MQFSSFLLFFRETKDEYGLKFVPKDEKPPSAPQIRPIEKYWALLKQQTYAGNWSSISITHLLKISNMVETFDFTKISLNYQLTLETFL